MAKMASAVLVWAILAGVVLLASPASLAQSTKAFEVDLAANTLDYCKASSPQRCSAVCASTSAASSVVQAPEPCQVRDCTLRNLLLMPLSSWDAPLFLRADVARAATDCWGDGLLDCGWTAMRVVGWRRLSCNARS